jgi:hypothetical protein
MEDRFRPGASGGRKVLAQDDSLREGEEAPDEHPQKPRPKMPPVSGKFREIAELFGIKNRTGFSEAAVAPGAPTVYAQSSLN